MENLHWIVYIVKNGGMICGNHLIKNEICTSINHSKFNNNLKQFGNSNYTIRTLGTDKILIFLTNYTFLTLVA